ncbi:MAG: ZIP family metal transporter [Elusimicrobia bacterium]|nr:ZIP family metal transporter [Elusimicrobiota bacterium]
MLLGINLLAVFATLLGGLLPTSRTLFSRNGIWRMFALRAGILLSVTFTEILPAAMEHAPTLAGWGALAAFLLFFIAGNFSMVDTCPEYLEECPVHFLGWAALAALCIHSFIDGFNLAISFSASAAAGSAVGLALTLHKIADGFTLTSLLRQSGYTSRQSLAGLAAVAVATPLGSLASAQGLPQMSPSLSALLLGFAGGSFLYISSADVLPRLHKTEDRASLVFFGAGMVAIAALQGISGG